MALDSEEQYLYDLYIYIYIFEQGRTLRLISHRVIPTHYQTNVDVTN